MIEREILEPVSLCTPDGRLDPAAVGFSRRPLHRCAIPGHRGRRKRWHHFTVTSAEHAFGVTFLDADYLGMASVFLVDLRTGQTAEALALRPLGWGVALPDQADTGTIDVRALGTRVVLAERPEGTAITVESRRVTADLVIERPPGLDSLTVALPLPGGGFQLTSKQPCRPARGEVRAGGRRVELGGASPAFGCLDFGRGVWPYRTAWNWASCAGVQDGGTVGLNLGAQWTAGSGLTENGLWRGGRLHKIADDVRFEVGRRGGRGPWAIRGPGIDLRLEPLARKTLVIPLGLLSADLVLVFGRLTGRALDLDVRGLTGWAEEFHARW